MSLSGSVSVGSLGPGLHKVWLSLLSVWQVRGLILNMILPLLPSCWGFSLALGCGISLFDLIQQSPVNCCLAASCSFGVLTREDEYTSFYSVILLQTQPWRIAEKSCPRGRSVLSLWTSSLTQDSWKWTKGWIWTSVYQWHSPCCLPIRARILENSYKDGNTRPPDLQISSVCVLLFETPWTAHQASLSITNSCSLLKVH